MVNAGVQRNIPQTSNGLRDVCSCFSFTKVMPGFPSHPDHPDSMCGFSVVSVWFQHLEMSDSTDPRCQYQMVAFASPRQRILRKKLNESKNQKTQKHEKIDVEKHASLFLLTDSYVKYVNESC